MSPDSLAEKPRERPSEPAPVVSRAPIPAFVSVAGLLALAIGAVVLALGRETVRSEVQASGPGPSNTLVRDVLTGRELTGDGRPETPATGWGSPERPIRIRFVPSADQSLATIGIDNLLAFVRARTGYAVQGAILRSYGLVVQEIVQGQADVAFLTAASYARARFATENNDDPGDDIEAIATITRPGDPAHPGSDLA